VRKSGLIALALAVGLSPAVRGATAPPPLTIGTATGSNFIPFSSYTGTDVNGQQVQTTAYEQIYSAALFSGPVEIQAISFFQTFNTAATGLVPGQYSFSFYTTRTGVGLLQACQTCNLTGPAQPFFTGSLPAATSSSNGSPLELTITGNTGGGLVSYDPSAGNLLLYVVALGQPFTPSSALGTIYGGLDSQNNSPVMSRAYFVNGLTAGTDNDALVTQFSFAAPAAVPEPPAWALMAGGLAGAGALVRRRLNRSASRSRG